MKLTKEQEAELKAARLKARLGETLIVNKDANHLQKDIKIAVKDVITDNKLMR